jgi:hypothetical protein
MATAASVRGNRLGGAFTLATREVSNFSELPDVEIDAFNVFLREQNEQVAKRNTDHETWRKTFDEKKIEC